MPDEANRTPFVNVWMPLSAATKEYGAGTVARGSLDENETVPAYEMVRFAKGSRASTVTVANAPVAMGVVMPLTTRVAAAAARTVLFDWAGGRTPSEIEIDCDPAVFRVAGNVLEPASVAVNVVFWGSTA